LHAASLLKVGGVTTPLSLILGWEATLTAEEGGVAGKASAKKLVENLSLKIVESACRAASAIAAGRVGVRLIVELGAREALRSWPLLTLVLRIEGDGRRVVLPLLPLLLLSEVE